MFSFFSTKLRHLSFRSPTTLSRIALHRASKWCSLERLTKTDGFRESFGLTFDDGHQRPIRRLRLKDAAAESRSQKKNVFLVSSSRRWRLSYFFLRSTGVIVDLVTKVSGRLPPLRESSTKLRLHEPQTCRAGANGCAKFTERRQ